MYQQKKTKSMKELKENLNILVVMTIINSLALWFYVAAGKTLHGIGYFLFFYVSIFTIHFFTKKWPPTDDFVVKEPKKELAIVILFTLLGAILITLNFYLKTNFENIGFLIKLPFCDKKRRGR